MVSIEAIQAAYYMVAATGVLVAAIYYVYNMRISQKNQELSLKAQQQAAETRQAQLFTQVYSRYDREFWKDWLRLMSIEYKSYDEWNKDRENIEISSARLAVSTYMMGIGTLVKRGLLSPEIVSDLIGSPVIIWWQKFYPFYKEYRVRANYPTYAADLEYLYDAMVKLKPAGYSPKWNPGSPNKLPQNGDD